MNHIKKLIVLFVLFTAGLITHGATFVVSNTNDSFGTPPAGSIREAINNANGSAGPHTIVFTGLVGPGPFIFNLVSPLTDLSTTNVTIDGTTAPGYNCVDGPEIVLVGPGFNSFDVSANSTILAISFRSHLVRLNAAGITMQGCWFNLNNTGTAGAGGSPGNNFLTTSGCNNCIVGGTGCGERNIISGFGGASAGQGLVNIATSDGLQFVGNYIGTSADGMTLLTNSSGEGIQIDNSDDVTIDGCVIAGCSGGTPDGYGIFTDASPVNNLTIQNCMIGVNAAGDATAIAFANDKSGIWLRASGTGLLIDNNIICNNGVSGGSQVDDCGISENASAAVSGTISNNFIGVDASYALGGNRFYGIYLFSRGSNMTITGNVIGDNGDNADPARYGGGISLAVGSNVTNIDITGNYIGIAPDDSDIGNHNNGIHIETGPSNITVGGSGANDGNYIGFNKGRRNDANGGIFIYDADDITILGNSIGIGAGGTAAGQQNAGGHARGGNGIYVGDNALRVEIGDMTTQNIIATNTGNGINVYNGDFVQMRWNSIYCNTEKGIDLNCGTGNDGNNGYGCGTITLNTYTPPVSSVSGGRPASGIVDVFGTFLCAASCSGAPQGQYRKGEATSYPTGTTWQFDEAPTVTDYVTVTSTGIGGDCNSGICRTSEFSTCEDNPLPLALLSFTGEHIGGVNYLDWTTIWEENVAHFEVERSTDGVYFEKVGTVKAVGNSTGLEQYGFEDFNLSSGVVYYRLKSIDVSGEFTYSNVVAIQTGDKDMQVYPNPNNGTFTIKTGENVEGIVYIFDVTGKIVFQTALQSGSVEVSLDMPSGAYVLQLNTANETFTEKLFVE